ncbi:peptidase domain-containing ABC transporter [Flavihumibacter fluvii]|uniref:peptidase domain-containing ABC transporter n=1 Tax=Flavihumibacter fluvii TaxID=2838157 RepID=UPI001BDE53EA|nr:peptidase domain-containing ABC transporter [Flavihumibacter fluvii]ULQ50642.1 peptidase domain-containing ABC transporter [Flavihumibacter fluvii]
MKKIPAIRQRDVTDCGAACLAAVLQYYGSMVPVSKIRQLSGTDQKGTNILGLMKAADAFGLQANGARGNTGNLLQIPTPAIVHVVLASGLQHFMVLVKAGKNKVKLMDPGDGYFHQMDIPAFSNIWSGAVIMLSPKADFTRQQTSVSSLRRFIRLALPLRFELLQALIGAVVSTILGLSTAFYLQKLVDDVFEYNNPDLLHILGGCMVLIMLVQILIGIIRNIICCRTGQIIDARLISGYYRHLFNLPQRFFDTMRVGEIVSRINDAVKIRLFINDIAMGIMLNMLIVTLSVVLLCFYYWKLAFLVLAIFPVYGILHIITTNINRKWQRKLMVKSADLEANLIESLQAAATVKRLGLEQYVVEKIEISFFNLMNSAYRAGIYNLYVATSADLINRLLTISVLWVGGWLVIQHQLTPGELLSFYSLIGYFTGPVAALITSGKGVQDALIAADRLFEIADLELECSDSQPTIIPAREHMSDIFFSAVSFRYGTRAIVLNNLSLCFRRGEITAVVGESGSGKSTIIHLLLNLYQVQEGQVRIGQIPIEHFTKKNLRALIGVVPQQVELFSGTIAENISVGDPSPDLDRIIRLCQSVGADDFIKHLPDGYFCKVGEKGTSLSGGQQQRLAIARALYKDPEVFIMDEATAHLDTIGERKIQELIHQLKVSGKTIILVAHRLSTIIAADAIHVLEKGKLLDSGNHSQLMQTCPYYASLWAPPKEKYEVGCIHHG